MKRIFQKNQWIVAALALMIAVAGYLNFSDRIFGDSSTETSGDLSNQELLDISQEEITNQTGDIVSQDTEITDGTVDGTPGEAVLTNAIVAEAKVTREQVRAQNKESLMEIIDNENVSDEQKTEAVNQLVSMTDLAEKELSAETMLSSKGFSDCVVSLTVDSADVVVHAEQLGDDQRAQIEDIVSRKTGIAPENIIITPVHEEE